MTSLYVVHVTTGRPGTRIVTVDVAVGTVLVPPGSTSFESTAAGRIFIAVHVRSAEHHPVSRRLRPHRISGVSAVPVHRQLVLTSLITDGERRVFSPVPQTASTLDLQLTTRL